MNITYWTNFSKRTNSTKQPTGGTQATVRLKEPCGISAPTFICSGIPDSVKYIQAFGRYYFVSEVTHNGGLIEISCVSDPMATFKSDIGSYSAWVERSQSNYDLNANDTYNQPTNDYDIATKSANVSGVSFDPSGTYIIGVMGKNASAANNANGIATYYAMTAFAMTQLGNVINTTGFLQNLINEFTNPMDCIISCLWLPLSLTSLPGTNSEIYLGSNATGVTAKLLSGRQIGTPSPDSIALIYPDNIPRDYRRNAPYSTAVVYLPFIGTVPLDLDIVYPVDSFTYTCHIDIFTGDIIYDIYKSGQIISSYSGNCATQIPLSASGYSSLGVSTGILSTIGGVAGVVATVASEGAALPVIAAAAGAVSGAVSASNSAKIHTTINGSSSSAIGVYSGTQIQITYITRKPLHSPSAIIARAGGVCNKQLTISSLSGYVKCNGASIDINGFDSDRAAINSYLNSGFYYE